MGTIYLLAGLVVFLGAHSTSIVAPAWRNRMLTQLGEQRWKAAHAAVSLAGFVLLVWGYGQARLDATLIYEPTYWLRHTAAILMVPVFPLLLSTYFPGRIKAAARHPMLLATKLWAVAHLLANGTLADVLLFGGFLAWAVADRISLKRRPAAPPASRPEGRFNDLIVVVAGFALYVWFVAAGHFWLFGVRPMTG